MSLEPEGSDMDATAKHGLCTQTFLFGVRLVHRYVECNMTYTEANNGSLAGEMGRYGESLESLTVLLIECS